MGTFKRPLKILTWHIHGNYLYYLTQAGCEFYLPVTGDATPGYGGKTPNFPWGANVHEVQVDEVKNLEIDCILYQAKQHYVADRYLILSPEQRHLPQIYLEHDPPQEHPTNTLHPVDDETMTVVHVTPFNALMWDNNRTPTEVIEHGISMNTRYRYTGEIPKGVVIVNNMAKRGRRLGLDVYLKVKEQIPLDLVGMNAEALGGIGEIEPLRLPEVVSRYRFLFNPIRYTSLGLAVCESMMLGLPVVGLATTGLVGVVTNGQEGYLSNDVDELILRMHELIENPALAKRLGDKARQSAQKRFHIRRFIREWEHLFKQVTLRHDFHPPKQLLKEKRDDGENRAYL